MSTQPVDQTASGALNEAKSASQFTKPYRQLAAFALLGANGLFLLVGIFDLLLVVDNWGDQFTLRASATYPVFVGLPSIGLPLLAVLLANHVAPVIARSREVTLTALVQYAVCAVFGLVTLIAGFIGRVSADYSSVRGTGEVRAAFDELFGRLGWFILFGVAGMLVLKIFQGAYGKPKPAPGVYGQPVGYPGYGQGYPQQAYPTPTGYPQATAGYPQATAGYPQVTAGYPQATAGYPQATAGYPQAPAGYPQAQSGYPAAGYSQPTGAYPAAPPAYPTQPAAYQQPAAQQPAAQPQPAPGAETSAPFASYAAPTSAPPAAMSTPFAPISVPPVPTPEPTSTPPAPSDEDSQRTQVISAPPAAEPPTQPWSQP